MAAVTAAVAVGAGMAYSANRQGAAEKKAGQARSNAAQQTIDKQQGIYDNSMSLAQPYYDAGTNAPADWESYGAWAKATTALKYAWGAAKGKRLNYFLFQLSFIGWWFLSALTLGILGLWITPYFLTSRAAFYLNRTGRAFGIGGPQQQ